MSDNWVVQNLQNALETWNEKLAEIWQLITTTPQSFKGGGIWAVIVNINGAVQAIGLALLVLFLWSVWYAPAAASAMSRNRNTLSSSLSDLRLQRRVSLTVWS